MSICDKIQYIGNTLEENLNDRGVDCTFGIGTNEQNISDMVELITNNNNGASQVTFRAKNIRIK